MSQRTYRVDVYNHDFSSQLTTFVRPKLRNVTIRLNKVTSALFEVPKVLDTATATNLAEMNKVKILRWSEDQEDHVPIWVGSIESIQEGDETWEVGCTHLLDVLDNRYTGSDENINGVAPTEIFSLLSSVNSAADTGIIAGSTDLTDSVNFTFNRKSVLQVLDDIIEAELEGEFEIDPDTLELNLMTSVGVDKSSTVVFIRDDDNPQANNVLDARIKTEGKEIFNYIVGQGKTSGGTPMTQIAQDATSIAARGRREKIVTFDEARDTSQLLAAAEAYLAQHKDPLIDLDVSPEDKQTITNIAGGTTEKGYDFFDDYVVGDLVMVKYRTGYQEIARTERVVEVRLSVDDASNETIQIKTTNEDQALIAEIVERTEEEELKRRLQNLENETYS